MVNRVLAIRQSSAENTVSPELRCPARVWGQPTRSHHASSMRVTLASSAPVNPLQTLLFDAQVVVSASSSVPGGRRSACR